MQKNMVTRRLGMLTVKTFKKKFNSCQCDWIHNISFECHTKQNVTYLAFLGIRGSNGSSSKSKLKSSPKSRGTNGVLWWVGLVCDP